jgi:hypothetical protein
MIPNQAKSTPAPGTGGSRPAARARIGAESGTFPLSKRQWIIVTENVCLTCPSVIARPHVDGILFSDSETKLRIQSPARCFRCHDDCQTPSG